MSRSCYSEDLEQWDLIRWRGAVASAIRGKRGQAFFKEMLASLDALPVKRLIAGDLEAHGEVCAIGVVGKARGVDMSRINPEDPPQVASAFGISDALAQEIMYMNDEWLDRATPETRFTKMRDWIASNIKAETPKP